MKSLIEKFYTAFQAGDAEQMKACYHDDIVFEDPGFGVLKGERAGKMWEMLLKRSKGELKIQFRDVEANESTGKAFWEAHYTYGPAKRKVHNKIHASFEFKDGKIIKHTDQFDLWSWSSQALGWPGRLMGWTPFFKNKLHQKTNALLDKYMAQN